MTKKLPLFNVGDKVRHRYEPLCRLWGVGEVKKVVPDGKWILYNVQFVPDEDMIPEDALLMVSEIEIELSIKETEK